MLTNFQNILIQGRKKVHKITYISKNNYLKNQTEKTHIKIVKYYLVFSNTSIDNIS